MLKTRDITMLAILVVVVIIILSFFYNRNKIVNEAVNYNTRDEGRVVKFKPKPRPTKYPTIVDDIPVVGGNR